MSDGPVGASRHAAWRSWSQATAGTCAGVALALASLEWLWAAGPRGRFVLGVAAAVAVESAVFWRVIETIPPSRVRRPLGALAMGAVWLALLPADVGVDTRTLATAAAVPVLLGFWWDWPAVSGRRGSQ
ncbi:hypothetical protein [Salinilacihabitans rarus]|uniref:hypothetical protein n=1 Tax=Salinilacihabitans rarus TaxID=2961596 RepID=UPI0020C88101|nr:hypothetical protein [Salinilacihabitans rarus]